MIDLVMIEIGLNLRALLTSPVVYGLGSGILAMAALALSNWLVRWHRPGPPPR